MCQWGNQSLGKSRHKARTVPEGETATGPSKTEEQSWPTRPWQEWVLHVKQTIIAQGSSELSQSSLKEEKPAELTTVLVDSERDSDSKASFKQRWGVVKWIGLLMKSVTPFTCSHLDRVHVCDQSRDSAIGSYQDHESCGHRSQMTATVTLELRHVSSEWRESFKANPSKQKAETKTFVKSPFFFLQSWCRRPAMVGRFQCWNLSVAHFCDKISSSFPSMS